MPAGGPGEERRDAGEAALHVQESEADHGEDGEVRGPIKNPALLIHDCDCLPNVFNHIPSLYLKNLI